MNSVMSEQDPFHMSPASKSAALVVARIAYYAGILLGTMFAAVAYSVVASNFGGITESPEKWMVAGVIGAVSIISYLFAGAAHSRIKKLK